MLVTNHNYNIYNIECNSATHSNYKHLELPDIVHEINNKRYSLQVEMNDLFYNDSLNIVCINCESVVDNNLIHHNIHHLEYNRNTTNERKIMSDLSKLGKIDMIIFNTIKIFKNVINKYQPKYIALINKKNNYLDGYEFYNNIYIKNDKKE